MDQSTISAIIIDDEPNAIDLLEMFLRGFPFIQVIGKENNAKRGLEMAKETIPELIFLDIDMPDMNGLAFAGKLQSENFYSEIVFTTAHQHYAYDALNIEPLDFLTKPFCAADLEAVIQKYKAKKEKEKQDKKLEEFINAQANTPKLKFPTTTGILFINVKNIVLLRAKSNNCELHLEDGTIETVTRNLNKVVSLLNSSSFFQTNRSTYINLNYLQRIDKKKLNCTVYFNQNVIEESISRSKMLLFEKIIKFPNIQE
jgi:DNA-binding LytR/AlgR family response regulator